MPTTTRKAGGSRGSPKKAANSSLKKSAFASRHSSPLTKVDRDRRHKLNWVGHQNGIMIVWPEKHNKEEEPCMAHDMDVFHKNPETLEKLQMNAILRRKGDDGSSPMKQAPGSVFDCRCFLCIIGEDNNNEKGRKEQVTLLLDRLNKNAVASNHKCPCKHRLGGDCTGTDLEPVDSSLLDKDILDLLVSAHPEESVGSLMDDHETIGSFWSNVRDGIEFMKSHSGTNRESPTETPAGLFDTDDDDNDDDRSE